ncbi:MAG: hypothetical protein VW450_00275 [Chloroflexota bacterium]
MYATATSRVRASTRCSGGPATPHVIIGESRYSKPVLDRLWSYEDSLTVGLRLGLLAFIETKASASNVDYPLDVALLGSGSNHVQEIQVNRDDGAPIDEARHHALSAAAASVAMLTEPMFKKLFALN